MRNARNASERDYARRKVYPAPEHADRPSKRVGCTASKPWRWFTAFGHGSTNINRYGIAIAETNRNHSTRRNNMACRRLQTCKIKTTMESKPTNAIGRSASHSALPDCAGEELPRIEPFDCKCKSHGCILGSLCGEECHWQRPCFSLVMIVCSERINSKCQSIIRPHTHLLEVPGYHAFHHDG